MPEFHDPDWRPQAASTQLDLAEIRRYAAGKNPDHWSYHCRVEVRYTDRQGVSRTRVCGIDTQGGWPGFIAHWRTIHARPGETYPRRP